MNSRLYKEVTELATEGELGEQLSPSPGSTVLMAHSLLPSRGSSAIIANVRKGNLLRQSLQKTPLPIQGQRKQHIIW